ncbi:MAG: PorT family protein [Bacteroidales bacterium]|nr:PorT family protein [Bacteroidales bacterium]MBN2756210.1 PorT family protein [Bacteroidales bacterium]
MGVKGGIGASKYYFQPFVKQDFTLVNKQGIVLNYLNNNGVGLQIEFNYTQKAWKEITVASNPQQMLLQYYEIPILTHIKIGKSLKSWPTISFGPHISLLNNHKYTANSTIDTSIVDYNFNNGLYSEFDYGLDISLGYEFHTSIGNFQFDIIYSQGLKDILARNTASIYQSLNQNMFFEFSYKIKIKDISKKTKNKAIKTKVKSKKMKVEEIN